MCGIVGIFDSRGQRDINRDLLGRMNDSQTHRGPDEHGLYTAPGIGLGHRRLSIIDLKSGQQPLFNDDKTVVVVYNGEIYNFQQLRQDLVERGYVFHTHCDTEVIVNAWTEWGIDCVHQFRGMFAFAIWDTRQEKLFLARDRIGIKPLYYAFLEDGTLIFGSELKSLLHYPGLPREMDSKAVEEYFAYGYIPDPKSIFKGVKKLKPGHYLEQRRGAPKAHPERYWEISFRHHIGVSEEAVCDDLTERLREAVRIRMIADVPLGAFLSGGVDSSAIVSLMAGLSKDAINTYSIGFDQPDYDETAYAEEVANQYHTNHHTRVVDPNDFDLIDRLASMYDEPFADSSAMPTYRVCELAREQVIVALSGDGGDEVFAGYRRYRWHQNEQHIREILPQALRGPVFGFLGRHYPKLDWAPRFLRAKTTFQGLAMSPAQAYFHSVSILSDATRARIFSPTMRRDLQGYKAINVLHKYMDNAPVEDELSRIQYADLKTYLPGDILTKVDRASMAHSLEVRVPLLDHRFLEWATKIPPRMRLRGQEGKYIFKKSLEGKLSDKILYRDKMGFAVPLENWFRGPLRDKISAAMSSEILADTGFFEMDYLKTLVTEHQSGTWNHSTALWALMMFESSLRHMQGIGK
jgi:asparagine synthase (glutamine-hydrolysing)